MCLVEGEQRVHGAIERRYRLRRERTVIDQEAAASMSLEDHRRLFAAAMAALLAEFNTYLDTDGTDPVADDVGYRQGVIWLSEAERAALIEAVAAAMHGRTDNAAAPDRHCCGERSRTCVTSARG